MNANEIRPGTRVRVTKLKSEKGILVKPGFLTARRLGAVGTVENYVPGHGGNVWWVRHKDSTIAAYVYSELEPEKLNKKPSSIKACKD